MMSMMGFGVSAMMVKVIAILAIMGFGVIYIDRSATARYEKNALAEAVRVQRRSTAKVKKESLAEAASLKEDLAGNRKRVAAYEKRFVNLKKRLKEARKKSKGSRKSSKPGDPCPVGCIPRW